MKVNILKKQKKIAESEKIRKSFKDNGYNIPKNHNEIKNIFMDEYKKAVKIVISDLQAKIKNDVRFSMSLDEATSINLRRYISMILHTDTDIINLGLKRIHGTMPAEKCVELVIEKLKTFENNLDEHIVSVPSDAASVMCKFGKLIDKKSSEIISAGPIHILCTNHGFHLVIMDVAYKIVAKKLITALEKN